MAAFFLIPLIPFLAGETSIGIFGFTGIFAPLFGMYLWHAKKCGIEVFPEGFVYGAPDKSKRHAVKWDEIAAYEIVPFEAWRARSFWRSIAHSDNDHMENEQVVRLTLFGGKKLALLPVYQHQPEFLELFKEMAKKARQQ